MGVIGRIHSRESFGAVDGPGIRFVLFVQGCKLRCRFCHNPDTWNANCGEQVNSDDIVKEIASYRNFIKSGGVTISGGEPLLQPEFTLAVINGCKKNGLHTAVDTAGFAPLIVAKPVIDAADLILLDIKALSDELCISLTGESNQNALAILRYCEHIKKPVWIRHVLVPDITLELILLEETAQFLSGFSCVQKVELLPFHKMGEYKWKELNLEYDLKDTREPTGEEIENAKQIFTNKGLTVV
ncbi:MAG: pyruvate formate-lyase-activating protein [Oscillospiraceae bacterium]